MNRESLLRFLKPDEDAASFFQRIEGEKVTSGIAFVDDHLSIRPGLCLELAGPQGCGKTEILVHMAVNCLLQPFSSNLNAKPTRVVLLDLDGQFDPLRLIQVLHRRIISTNVQQIAAQQAAQGIPRYAPMSVDAIFTECLSRFHLVRCQSSFEFLAALAVTVPRILEQQMTCPQHQQQQRCMRDSVSPTTSRAGGFILVDNIGAFHYQDRASKVMSSGPPAASMVSGGHGRSTSSHSVHPPLIPATVHSAATALLQHLAQEHRFCIITTRSAMVIAQDSGSKLSAREYLTAAWQQFITHRLVLQRIPLVDGYGGTRIQAQWQEPGHASGVFRVSAMNNTSPAFSFQINEMGISSEYYSL